MKDETALDNSGKTEFLYVTSFWRGNSYTYNNYEYIAVYYYSDDSSDISRPNNSNTFGIRPEVIIQK